MVLDERGESIDFLRTRLTGQRGQVERLDLLAVRHQRVVDDRSQSAAFIEAGAASDQPAVHHDEGLQDRGRPLEHAVAFIAKRIEEFRFGLTVLKLTWHGERLERAQGHGEAVENFSRRESARTEQREMLSRLLSVVRETTCQLVGSRADDDSDKELQVEVVCYEFFGEKIEDLWMSRRVGLTEIVNGLDETSPEKMPPQPINRRPRETRVCRRRDPVGERLSR